jgi:hypothetical protein
LVVAFLITASPGCMGPVKAQTVVPDPNLTPGAVRTTDVADVCTHGTNQLRHMTNERRDWLMREYNLPPGPQKWRRSTAA